VTGPDVSILIAAWKAEGYLSRAVASALASTDLDVEVIIVDDASPDGTYVAAQQLADTDPRTVTHRLAANSGPSAARNQALALARGRYVAVLDADDAFLPGRLSALVKHAEATGVDIVVDNMIEVDDAGNQLGSSAFLKSAAFATDREIDLLTWIAFNQPMKGGDCIGYLKPLIRRDTLITSEISYDTTLRNSEDYYLVANLLAAGKRMRYLATPGYLYTRSRGSTSFRLKPEHTRAWLAAEQRLAEVHGPQLSTEVRKAIGRRLRALRNVNQLVAATHAVQARKLGDALAVMASDAQGALYTLGVFARIAMGKILRRKLV
jgi:succinoglycan biosynthesis protein ExoO